MSEIHTRRNFVKRAISWGFYSPAALLLLSSCEPKKSLPKKENEGDTPGPCADSTGLSQADQKMREGLGYLRKSPVSNMRCNNCNLWIPPAADGKCSGCLLFKGPVEPLGYCTNWAPKT